MNKQKSNGGRPKLNPAKKKNHELPHIRVSVVEYYSLKAKVRQADVSLTEYIRQCILNGYVVERVNSSVIGLYHQLAGIANNLNQLAHQANAHGYHRDAELYHDNALQVNKIIKEITDGCKNIKRK